MSMENSTIPITDLLQPEHRDVLMSLIKAILTEESCRPILIALIVILISIVLLVISRVRVLMALGKATQLRIAVAKYSGYNSESDLYIYKYSVNGQTYEIYSEFDSGDEIKITYNRKNPAESRFLDV